MAPTDLHARTGRPSRRWAGRLAVMGFAAQAMGALLVWFLVDDKSSGAFSNDDFREWATFGAVLGGFLAALAGFSVRRLWVSVAVAAGCLLAMSLGCAVFVGYAVATSA